VDHADNLIIEDLYLNLTSVLEPPARILKDAKEHNLVEELWRMNEMTERQTLVGIWIIKRLGKSAGGQKHVWQLRIS
jgi:hypothetical protein